MVPALKNAAKINALSRDLLGRYFEAEPSLSAELSRLEKTAAELARLDADSEPLLRIQNIRLDLEDVLGSFRARRQGRPLDPARLEEVFSRLELIARLKKKYDAADVSRLLDQERKIEEEKRRLEDLDENLERLNAQREAVRTALEEAAAALHEKRRCAAEELSSRVLKRLEALGLAQARFLISLDLDLEDIGPGGADRVEYQISLNPGHPPQSLRRAASGGELSRLMLAIKCVLAQEDRSPILVFDEIDAGVGGSVARAVGSSLLELSKKHQVLLITHLPQVASYAHTHFHVTKQTRARRTRARVERLSADRRVEVLASMMAGLETQTSRRHAQELLSSSQ